VKAVVYSGYGAIPVLTEVPAPACPADGVVIMVGATGVCRSDWHAWKGHDPVGLPHIGGHEFAGMVAAAGPEVTRWRPGDRVTAPFACGCGRCEFCLAGNAQVCPRQTQPGFTGPGSFAELVAVHAADANLITLPAGVSFVTAACLGCRFATAFRAVTAHGRVRPGDWLAVHGCGGVGLSAVMIGAALGARVVAVDVSAAARERARELGAEAVVDAAGAGQADGTGQADGAGQAGDNGQAADTGQAGNDASGGVAAAVAEITGGGAHVSVDALGSPAVAAVSLRCLRSRGRHVQVGLLPGGPVPLPMDLVIARELEVYGSHGMAARDYPAMMRMVADGTLRPALLTGDVIGLEGVGQALAAMDAPSTAAGMTVVRLTE
jgi:alcohol dehydrogenase